MSGCWITHMLYALKLFAGLKVLGNGYGKVFHKV